MKDNQHIDIFQKYLPGLAVSYCYELWIRYRFSFKITRKRNTKLGDYRFNPQTGTHLISVNHNLNPYAFLMTYIHEVAHLVTYLQEKKHWAPHGQEWKRNFRQLMTPLLIPEVFPAKLLTVLKKHMINPKASSYSDPQLILVFREFDQPAALQPQQVCLAHIQSGEQFKFNQRWFAKEKLVRTRVLCREIKTGKKFLISQLALVEKET
ncbi:MAG: SprT-like domain-containing protein [Candidatus Cyclobacteriaceae bacterium M3_2C_046]